jgi:hypothetical protein
LEHQSNRNSRTMRHRRHGLSDSLMSADRKNIAGTVQALHAHGG